MLPCSDSGKSQLGMYMLKTSVHGLNYILGRKEFSIGAEVSELSHSLSVQEEADRELFVVHVPLALHPAQACLPSAYGRTLPQRTSISCCSRRISLILGVIVSHRKLEIRTGFSCRREALGIPTYSYPYSLAPSSLLIRI